MAMQAWSNDQTRTAQLDESGLRARAAMAQRKSAPSIPSFPFAAGRYLVSEPIARGGQATVHLAATASQDVFAMKRLHPHLESDENFTKMLLDESAINSRVRHRNVVTMHGVEIIDDRLFLVMDYVEGLPLSGLMTQRFPHALPARVVVAIVAGALRGLHAAHEVTDDHGRLLGVVHRDVSPQNILVGVDGVARMLDFGVAKAARRLQTTRKGEVKGKLAYMSPEQLVGGRIDRRTDVYAAGIVLWEALTASPLFHAESETETLALLLDGCNVRPSERASDVPPALDAVVMRALAVNPDDRYATALEMAIALERVFPKPASAPEVAHWVKALGAETLREHRAVRDEILEGTEPQTMPSAIVAVPPPPPPSARASDGERLAVATARRQRKAPFIGIPVGNGPITSEEINALFRLVVVTVLCFVAAAAIVAGCRSVARTTLHRSASPAALAANG